MATRLSRRKLSIYAAEQIIAGASIKKILSEIGAYLIDTGLTDEQELLVRDIEVELASRGIIVADVTSARALDQKTKGEIATLVGAKHLQFREAVDPTVIGGIRIDTPGKRFDGTIRHKLNALKAKQL